MTPLSRAGLIRRYQGQGCGYCAKKLRTLEAKSEACDCDCHTTDDPYASAVGGCCDDAHIWIPCVRHGGHG